MDWFFLIFFIALAVGLNVYFRKQDRAYLEHPYRPRPQDNRSHFDQVLEEKTRAKNPKKS